MRVTLTIQDANAQGIELLGEVSHWDDPHPFRSLGSGHFELTLDLEPGTYAVKALADRQRWCRVPGLPVDRVLGTENSTLVVGGAPGPLIFAPSRRHWVRPTERLLLVHAELEEACAGTPAEGVALELLSATGRILAQSLPYWIQSTGGRALIRYRVTVPAGAECVRFSCGTDCWALPSPETHPPPSCLNQGCIYSIFIDRWFRGSAIPDERAVPRSVRSTRSVVYGGDLEGIRQHLDYIVELGATAIALTPLFLSETPHRYDAWDFRVIDPRLGGDKALQKLVEACHARGLAVVLDAAFSHCHAEHFAFRDLLQRQRSSPYQDWFQILRFPVSRENPQTYRHYWQMPHLPLTNLASPTLQEHVLAVVESWLDVGIDGIRLDAADMAPDLFWQRLSARVHRRGNEAPILIAESVTEPSERYLHNGAADIVFDFPMYSEFVKWFAAQRESFDGFVEQMEAILHRRGPETAQRRLWFLDNHDTNRFVTEATFFWRLRLALVFLLLRPEPVWLYYGTELAVTSRERSLECEGTWPDRLPMPPTTTQTRTKTLVQKLLLQRKQLREQGFGEALFRRQEGHLVVYERHSAFERMAVLLNFSDDFCSIPTGFEGGQCLLHVQDDIESEEGNIAPHAGCVLLWHQDTVS